MSTRFSFDEALLDVAKVYRHPQAICDDSRLTAEQKVKLLKQWEYDLRELQVASDENMTGDGSGQSAELLRAVRKCLKSLHADNDLELTGASKQGG